MQRKMNGEVGLELACTVILCFAESNDLGLQYSNHNFNESSRTIILLQAALSLSLPCVDGYWPLGSRGVKGQEMDRYTDHM